MRTYDERIANIRAKARANKRAKNVIVATLVTLSAFVLLIYTALFPQMSLRETPSTDGPALLQPSDPIVTQPTGTNGQEPTSPTTATPFDTMVPTEPVAPTEPQIPKDPETVVHAFLLEESYQSNTEKPTVTTYERDEFGRLIRKYSANAEYTAVYNEKGLLAQLTDQDGDKILYTYDSYGNLTRGESFANGSQTGLEEYAYFYDTLGRVTEKTYIQRTTLFRIEYTYHGNGKVATERKYSNDVLTGEYTYNEAGWLDKYVKYNSVTGDKVYSETYHHSETTSTAKRVNPDREVLATINYTYDEYGNVVKQTVQETGKSAYTYTYSYMYVEENLGIRVDYSAEIDSGGGIYAEEELLIRTVEELEARFGKDSAICDRYSNTFFESNTLIFISLRESSGMARHQVTGMWKDEAGNYRVQIDRIYPEVGTEDEGSGFILITVNEQIPMGALLFVEDTTRIWSNDAWDRLYGNGGADEEKVILPQRPEDYELEYWIGEDVTDVNWDRYSCYVDGETVDLYMAKGYQWHIDDRGNKFFPVAYVYYEVTTLDDGRKFITAITIADPDIKVYGVGMNSTKDRFQRIFEELGYAVEQYGTSNGVHIATSNGVVFLHHYYEKIVISVDNLSFTEKTPEPVVPVERVAHRSNSISTTMGNDAWSQPMVIRSVAELQAFLDICCQPDGSFEAVLVQAAVYNDAFFEGRSLILMPHTETSGSNRVQMTDITRMSDGSIRLSVNRILPGEGSDSTGDMAYWYIFAEIDELLDSDTVIYTDVSVTESRNFNPGNLEVAKDIQLQIKDAYISQLGQLYSADSVELTFYGIFENAYALFINCWNVRHIAIPTVEKVYGLDFYYHDTNEMVIYASGRLYGLAEAAEQGVISRQDLGTLYCNYYTFRPNLQHGWEYALPAVPEKDDFNNQSLIGQIPEHTRQSIRQAFLETFLNPNEPYTVDDLSLRVFGVFGDNYALFVDGVFSYSEGIYGHSVHGYEFFYLTTQELLIYHDGQLQNLYHAYLDGWITEVELRTIYGNYYLSVPELFDAIPYVYDSEIPEPSFNPKQLLEQISEEEQKQICQDFVDQFVDSGEFGTAEDVSLRVFGIFGDTYALFADGIFAYPDAESGESVNGTYFTYSSYQEMYIYANGCFYHLQEAYDAQLLMQADILVIYENYYAAYPWLFYGVF